MQLRHHPLITRRDGVKIWPPLWTLTTQDKADWPHGEIGILERVWIAPQLEKRLLFMFVRHGGFRYMGSMLFDRERFCLDMYSILQNHLGRSIAEIGDLDLSYML